MRSQKRKEAQNDAIEASGLCKRYENKNVVDHLNIQVPEGAIYGFIGHNGVGKSTTKNYRCIRWLDRTGKYAAVRVSDWCPKP